MYEYRNLIVAAAAVVIVWWCWGSDGSDGSGINNNIISYLNAILSQTNIQSLFKTNIDTLFIYFILIINVH